MLRTVQRSARHARLPFENGDTMDQPTFHELYKKTPDGFKAELIQGIVYMASPVRTYHGLPHSNLAALLAVYAAHTPGVQSFIDSTAILGEEDEPQPDISLMIQPDCGGQATFNSEGYITGAPELLIEVSVSTMTIDLNAKLESYESAGVQEYIVAVEPTESIRCFRRTRRGLTEVQLDADEIFRSEQFPGLWLDAKGVFDPTAKRLLDTLQQGLATPEHTKFIAKLKKKRK
jgi:Uma2 family endonuclease